jgi:NAD-dependent DNA ligase
MIETLVTNLRAASYAYHNGQTLLMTDAAFDTAVDQLRSLDPSNPFLSEVGAETAAGDEVVLPYQLPSLNKAKEADPLAKWLAKNPADRYQLSTKLDGCSALWMPKANKLYTRGDGVKGRDISVLIDYLRGLPTSADLIVRGELIMRTDSSAIPTGKLARNIVAGALNRKFDSIDEVLMGEIRFVAYELIQPSALIPEEAYRTMRRAGYEVARSSMLAAADMTAERLAEIFTIAESNSPYQIDGIVIAPNIVSTVKRTAKNPTDRIAWKTRLNTATARTTVRQVEWNVSHQGFLIPRVLFDTVNLAGANIAAATGLHGRWIFENAVGPGAEIEVRRAGDVIPQIIAVHIPAPTGPAMPARYTWEEKTELHVLPVADDVAAESACIKITHALSELGAENVGPGLVAKLYAAGFKTVGAIFAATATQFAERVSGCKGKMADRIFEGLRTKQSTWTELNLLCASCTMPRGVGHTKLQPLLEIQPNPSLWTAAEIKTKRPAGLSDTTIDAIMDVLPAYLAWRTENALSAAVASPVAASEITNYVVLTGFRDKALEADLAAKGYGVADAVTRKIKYLVHPDGPTPSSTKVTKAQSLSIPVITVSALRSLIV